MSDDNSKTGRRCSPAGATERSHGWSDARRSPRSGTRGNRGGFAIPPQRGGGMRTRQTRAMTCSRTPPPPLQGGDVTNENASTGFAALHPWLQPFAPLRQNGMRRCNTIACAQPKAIPCP
jgi:hypothetical protein